MTDRHATQPTRPRRSLRAFSLIEMLMALTISATLLAATLSALDASWRSYKVTTESASTHVVTRIVVHRVLAMIRTGAEFGPYPEDVLDPALNPVQSTFIEFVTEADRLAGIDAVTRIERRNQENRAGAYELWYVRLDTSGEEPVVVDEHPLISNVQDATFIMEFEPGPRLKRATVDLTVQPNDDSAISTGGPLDAPTIRLVTSTSPRDEGE